ncbi:META domain-containing protein [Flavobacterium branchiicola]|uniref:META domain-containing protein n=1 Tax=Flavobacterium branchiicola TaxID=1114875 RepID=A0ABV9PDG3_9FLAO|nr:META domain-containing protein [Flavobacterium branchiicola]MBS7254638.1 META domain-containing protein [Flavobacterium branchiicola]
MMKNFLILVFFSSILISCKCKKDDSLSKLEGNWELNYIAEPTVDFDAFYPNKKPAINFNVKENHVSGNNGCNSFNGKLSVTGNKIDFTQPMAVTKMMCMDGKGEQVFMNTLKRVTSYDVTDDGKTLNFISGDIATMRFTKK